ncbi:hypothetical protein AVEN_25400-1, partial [Araneus ventricosus]
HSRDLPHRASCQSKKIRKKHRVPRCSLMGNTSLCHVGTSGSSDLAWDFRRVRAFLWPGSKMSVSLSTTSVIRNVSSEQEFYSGCSLVRTGVVPLELQNQLARTRPFSLLKLLLRC